MEEGGSRRRRRTSSSHLLSLVTLTGIILLHAEGTAGRIFDVESIPTESIVVEAGGNLTLPCPGTTEQSLVSVLEWVCHGCFSTAYAGGLYSHSAHSHPQHSDGSSSSSSGVGANFVHGNGDVKVVELRRGSTTIWQNMERVALNSTSYSLNFHPVTARDSGEYKCLVNDRRLPESILKLVVQDVPDPPGRPLILSFTSRTVNLSWASPRDNHNSRITHYVIYTRVGEDGEWDEKAGTVTEDNKTGYQMTGLRPFTVYSFRVAAVNALGASPPSKESYYFVTLREVPDGKPTITAAQNASSTSIRLAWKAPPRDTIHGEFIGYRIAFKQRDRGQESIQEIYLRDPNIQMHIIPNLLPFTQYLVSLQVLNPEGLGPPTTVVVITDEGVPERPENLSVSWISDSLLQLSWSEPAKPNGKLEGYRIYYLQNNMTDVVTLKNPTEPLMKHTLMNLEAFTEYKIWVKAFTWKNEGESSSSILAKTDVRGPSPPHIMNMSCLSEDSLYVEWHRPTTFYNSIDFYYVDFRSSSGESDFGEPKTFDEMTLLANHNDLDHSVTMTNLTVHLEYEVRVRGGTRSVLEPGKVYKGLYSETRRILMKPNCEKVHLHARSGASSVLPLPGLVGGGSGEFTPEFIFFAGAICTSFLLVLSVFITVVRRRCSGGLRREYYHDPPRISPLPPGGPGWEGEAQNPVVANGNSHSNGSNSNPNQGAIPGHLFAKHVSALHADGDIGFSKEYEMIQAASAKQNGLSSDYSQHPENQQKNRYLNIVAYDHTRVRLQPAPGQKRYVDYYVNANYIDGFKSPGAFIATQGPLPSTFDSFWRMVWEHNVHVIVMITNLVEGGRKKCDQYWPNLGSETYGVMQLLLLKEEMKATYTVRTFQLKHLKLKKKKHTFSERLVVHFHFTSWPDHGTPEHPLPVMSFIKKSSSANPVEGGGPILVHCSAGVGRTGAYIVLEGMSRQFAERGDVNICGFLSHIRKQRNFLVQTEEQYVFTHDALLEAIESGDTAIKADEFKTYLQQSLADPNNSLLQAQYKLVTRFAPQDFHLASAMKGCNLSKNRNLDCLPCEKDRVRISPSPGVEGSDYINATFLPGYHHLQEFIVTQHPLASTIPDFWQMVWDHRVKVIVLLSSHEISSSQSQEYPTFWPVSTVNDIRLNSCKLSVKFLGEEESCSTPATVLSLSVKSTHDGFEWPVKLLICSTSKPWPHSFSPPEVFQLVNMTQDQLSHGDVSVRWPICVADRFGGTEAATFAALTTLSKQVKAEGLADVYMYAKLYHELRPGIWKSLDDYLHVYRCVEALCSSMLEGVNGTTRRRVPSYMPPLAMETFQVYTNGNGMNIPTGNGWEVHGEDRLPPDGMEQIDGQGYQMTWQ